MNDGQRNFLRLHSVDVFVRDLKRSVEFYREKLGFEVAFDASLQDGRHLIGVSPPDGSAVLTLIQPNPGTREYDLIGRATRIVLVTEDVAHTYREWSARGVHFRYTPRLRRIKYRPHIAGRAGEAGPVWGQVSTRFDDLDRNSFVLVSFDEVNRAMEAQRRAIEEQREAERRAAYELSVARQVQARLFPQTPPACRTLEFAGVCAQARQVGGDYYDFLPLAPGRIGLVIGDIAGKGIAAALLMAHLQAQLRSHCAVYAEQPELVLRSVNRLFFENTATSAYATLFFGEYDDERQHLRYANCGHLAGLLLKSDSTVERLASTSTVLGLFQAWDCALAECSMAAGDVLALYTDGATESFDSDSREFGEDGLIAALRELRDLKADELADALLKRIQSFAAGEQHDDITLIVAKCGGS